MIGSSRFWRAVNARIVPIIASCLLGWLCLSGTLSAANYTTTVPQTTGADWTASIWQFNGTGTALSPAAGNTYECIYNGTAFGNTNNTRVRNPSNLPKGTVLTFPGDCLTLDTNTEIRLKNGTDGTPSLNFPGANGQPGLVLNGGVINIGDTGTFTNLGLIQVASQSYINAGNNGGGSAGTNRAVSIAGNLTGSGNLVIFQCTTDIPQIISGPANAFSGQWIVKAGWLLGATANSLGTNSITVDPSYTLPNFFGSLTPISGPAVLEVGYDLISSGTLTLANGGMMNLHQNCTFSQVYIQQTPLSAGTHPYSELASGFPNSFFPSDSGSLTVLSAGPPLPTGKIYYVDKSASNASDGNSGTSTNSPWKTIQHAATTAQAGDTVYIKAGTYPENVSIRNSGAANAWITFSAYPGQEQQAVLNPGSITVSQASYISISGLKVANTTNSGHSVGIDVVGPGGNYQICGNYITNTVSSGIAVWGLPYAGTRGTSTDPSTWGYKAITNVLIANNTIDYACNGGYDEQLDIANGVDCFEVRSNILKNGPYDLLGGEGIDCKEGASNGKIWGNQIFNNAKYGIYLEAGESKTNYYQTPGVLSNILVYNNSIHDNGNHGIGITSEGRGNIDGITLYNNLCFHNGSDGILLYDYGDTNKINYCQNVAIINNTIYSNAYVNHNYGGIHLDHKFATGVIVRNNIAYNNNSGSGSAWQIWNDTTNTSITMDHNVLGPSSVSLGNGTVSQNKNGADPKFVNAAGNDFHLLSTSPAIGYGSSNAAPTVDYSGNARPYGLAWDSGAYEYSPLPPWLSIQVLSDTLTPAITLQGTTGAHYQMQYRGIVNTGSWTLLQDIPTLTNSSITITDSTPLTQRFYRATAP